MVRPEDRDSDLAQTAPLFKYPYEQHFLLDRVVKTSGFYLSSQRVENKVLAGLQFSLSQGFLY